MADVIGSGAATTPAVTAASRYKQLEPERDPALQRAYSCSELTIPGLLPRAETAAGAKLPEPYQSTGADGTNNLASKLLLVLFTPPWFRLDLAADVARMVEEQGEEAVDEFRSAIAQNEKIIFDKMEEMGTRAVRFEACQHLIVAGNALMFEAPDGSEKFFALDKYVVCRDVAGNPLEIVVKETLAKESLPKRARALVRPKPVNNGDKNGNERNIDLYTWVQRGEKGWTVFQEIDGQRVPGSNGTYPLDNCAWLPLRWRRVSGEAYGRGHCEEYLGALRTHDTATESIVKFGAAASKILFGVNENGTTDPDELANADTGDVLNGDFAKDVTVLQLEKSQDFGILAAVDDKMQKKLERAFLLIDAVQRDAERVTAEEIRAMIGQLEETQGGVYAILSEEWQRPVAKRYMLNLQKSGDLPPLPSKTVKLTIITGLDGLGRNNDMNKLDAFVAGVAEVFGPQVLPQYVNVGEYMRRKAAALGIDAKNLVRTDKEVQQQQQQAAQQSTMDKIAPSLVSATQKGAELAQTQQQTPEGAPVEQG
jgi:hypothetical protein